MALGLLAGYSTGHCSLRAQNGEAVLLVANRANALSQRIADYYIAKRGIPLKNVCQLDIPSEKEEIDWDTYVEQVERPIARCLAKANLTEQVLYVVTTMGVPLKVSGGGQGLEFLFLVRGGDSHPIFSPPDGTFLHIGEERSE